jgi:O-methyltransferase
MERANDTSLVDRYLDLIQDTLLNAVYGESRLEVSIKGVLQRIRHPYLTRHGAMSWPPRAHTMLPRARLDNLRRLTQRVLKDNVAGDFIETGVWRGGACILLRAILAAHCVHDRRVFVADSFEGLPKPDTTRNPADKRDHLFAFEELAVSRELVRDNFARYGLLDDQVVFLKGYFQDTLPKLTTERFALIRLDGDMYGSTMDALTNLYDKLSPNGFVIVDDYGAIRACRKAVHDFLDQRHLTPQINNTDQSEVWWQKS